ncbi:MAG: glycosyltransferase [Gammaproteobacteria bacterium]|uniref:Glycosyltransferase n=1 Tax=SAR86 cluster bacterium TaxID=2030880 RepID=A0A520MYJ4_9GAMM|nr:glycosyltransferase [SAR86 cluster bacterium]RZO26300.1 MAG: glycosyltransferase [SAR86 cluster bacterium]|tara:strand:+ start:959 stop:1723 length:765 start_codon:yes stop_codon:yes gene_type:complete
MPSPRISVIINCKNGEIFLEEVFKALKKQKFKDFEVIFLDSGSVDGSKKIFDRYKEDNYFYVEGNENDSLAESRNKAVKKSRGEWLCFNDQDDIYLSERFSDPMKIAEKDTDLKLIFSDFEKIDLNSKSLGSGSFGKCSFSNVLLGTANVGLLTLTVKRDCFDSLGGFDERYPHSQDYHLILKIIKKHKFHYIDKVLAKYRIHNKSMSSQMLSDGSLYLETAKIAMNYLPRPEAVFRVVEMYSKYLYRKFFRKK